MRKIRGSDEALDTPSPEAPDAVEVARGFLRGDPPTAKIVRERVERIVAFRGYGISAEDRKDLVQQVLAQAWQRMNGRGLPSLEGFWGFIEVVAARRCIDWLRSRRTRKVEISLDLDLVDESQDPHRSAVERERRRLAVAALRQLSEPCRRLIYLHAGHGLSYREISEVMGKSEGALRIQMVRCLERARRAATELTDADGLEFFRQKP